MLDMGLSFMTFIILSYIPSMGFPGGSVVKNPPANARDAGSIPGSGSSPGEGNSNPLEYSYLGNPMDRGTWWATPTWGHKRVRHNLATKQQHSLYTHFVESFYHKWMLNFVKCFFCIYWDNLMIFILYFVDVVYQVDWSVDIEPSLHPWDKFHLIMVYRSFVCIVQFSLLIFWWGFFFIYVLQGYWPVIFFSYVVLVWFWYQDNGTKIKWVWKSSLLLYFLEKIVCLSLTIVSLISPKPVSPAIC